MKIKYLIFVLVLCLALTAFCACGSKDADPTDAPATSPNSTEPATEPTDKGIFVTEDIDLVIPLPEELQGMTLPDDEFGDDVTGIFESHPITEPEETETPETQKPTDPPAPTSFHPDILPDDIIEE